MERIINMSTKEIDRLELLSQVTQKRITQSQGADIFGISVRDVRRLFKGYRRLGTESLLHLTKGVGNSSDSGTLRRFWADICGRKARLRPHGYRLGQGDYDQKRALEGQNSEKEAPLVHQRKKRERGGANSNRWISS